MYSGPRVDSDIHHAWRNDEDVIQYLPKRWQDYVRLPGSGTRSLVPPYIFNPAPNGVNSRLDAFPESGAPAGSDLELMRKQLLDPFRIDHAVLSFEVGAQVGLANVEFATEVTRALNRWSMEHWLEVDPRLYGSLLVSTQLPEVAAEDVRTLGRHPRIAEVLLMVNGLGKPFGHPVYHPIYEAAVEIGKPVSIHIGGDTFLPGAATHVAAGGMPTSRFERHTLQMQPLQHYLISFIVHGVFEKYPDLRLLLKETGVAWIPWLMWELDAYTSIFKMESHWVRRRPSEYFRDHVRLTTQPLEEPTESATLIEALETFGGVEDLLCFSSDYPHHDTDDADYVAKRLPSAWWDRVFHGNAMKLYGWSRNGVSTAAGTAARSSGTTS